MCSLRFVHAKHDAAHLERGVQSLRQQLHRFEQLRQTLHRKELRLHRNDHFIGKAQTVERENAEARRTIDQHEIKLVLHRFESRAQNAIAIRVRREFGLGTGEVGGRRQQPKVVAHLHDTITQRAVVVDERVIDRATNTRAIDSKMQRQVRLRVEVDQQRATTKRRDRRSDVDG